MAGDKYNFLFIKFIANRYVGFLLFLFVYTMIIQKFGGLPSALTAWRF